MSRPIFFASILCLATPLVARHALAQEQSESQLRAGVAYRSAKGQQLGVIVARELGKERMLSTRVEVSALWSVRPPTELALAYPGPDVDGRRELVTGIASFVATLSRPAPATRTWFLSAHGGATVVRWGAGGFHENASFPATHDPQGTTTFAFHLGVGTGREFPIRARPARFFFDVTHHFDPVAHYYGVRMGLSRAW